MMRVASEPNATKRQRALGQTVALGRSRIGLGVPSVLRLSALQPEHQWEQRNRREHDVGGPARVGVGLERKVSDRLGERDHLVDRVFEKLPELPDC